MYRPTFKTKRNKVPILSKNDIEIIGENFLRDFCPKALENPQAIDVEGFVEMYLGLKVDYQYLSSDGRYLGMMVFNDTDKVIIFDSEKMQADYLHADAGTVLIDNSLLEENQEHRYRYTMGHEGAHSIFHSAVYAYDPNQLSLFDKIDSDNLPMVQCRSTALMSPYNSGGRWSETDWMEWQANFFSSVLLMSAKAIKKIQFETQKNDLLQEISMIQKVSKIFNVSPEAAKYRLEELGYFKSQLQGDISFLNSNILPL